MKTESYLHNWASDFPCCLCGEWHQQGNAAVRLVDDDVEESLGDVCPKCIEAGPAGAADRGLQYALHLMELASELVSICQEVRGTDAEAWATLEDLRKAESDAHAAFLADGSTASPFGDWLKDVASQDEGIEVVDLRNQGTFFGDCPECGEPGTCVNVGRDHWFVCDEHKVRWYVGSNLFSGWQSQNPEAWEQNKKTLAGYSDVTEWGDQEPHKLTGLKIDSLNDKPI